MLGDRPGRGPAGPGGPGSGSSRKPPRTAADLTVREVIRHFAGYYPRPAIPAELIAAVGLAGQASTRLRQLSGGQRRRVDLALGLLGQPELLFLDEPTTGLDPEARRHFWELIRELAADGHHDPADHALPGRGRGPGRPGRGAGRPAGSWRPGRPRCSAAATAATATVRWQDRDGGRSRQTVDPTQLVAALAATAAGADGEIPGLTVTRPSLEDVYLELIGARPAPAQLTRNQFTTAQLTSTGQSDELSAYPAGSPGCQQRRCPRCCGSAPARGALEVQVVLPRAETR